MMLQTLQKLKQRLKKQTQEYQIIEEIEKEITKKKYGLLWEQHEEEVDKKMKTCIPVFQEQKQKAILLDPNKPLNFLLEGDNLHSLYLLEKTHKNTIDVIYIDPPYNTLNNDFKYDDTYVDAEDGFKHSKWLSFMEKRLKIAKKLLSQEGVMFISIDDHEVCQLKLLCDAIFGETNTDMMIWRKSGMGREGKMKNTTTFRKDHEYILVCYKEKKKLNKIKEIPEFINEYPNPDKDPRGPYKAGSISRKESASNPNHGNYYTVTAPKGKQYTRQFDIPKEEFMRLCQDIQINEEGKPVSRIYWGKNDNSVPAVKIFVNEIREITPYSVLLSKGTTTEGTKELNEILKGDYSRMRPKPVNLIKTLIQLASKETSIVLDFFAGSGTTGQAVLELNQTLGGNRSFILCTNNEVEKEKEKQFQKEQGITEEQFQTIKQKKNKKWKEWEKEYGICSTITYPRITNILKGYQTQEGKLVPGIKGNLKYYTTEYIKKAGKEEEYIAEKLLEYNQEMIELENNKLIQTGEIQVIYSDRELDQWMEHPSKITSCKKLYLTRQTLLTQKQKKELQTRGIQVLYIPEQYFSQEMREAEEW